MAADILTRNTLNESLLDNYNFDDDLEADLTFDDQVQPLPPLQDTRDDKPTISPRAQKRKLDLDIFGDSLNQPDVKIRKQRDPIPKLDADRLLSDPGIPKLRKMVRDGSLKKRLRLKGKGHEMSDAARLLNFYQIWLDGLYPRAKFADALTLVEKAGHGKRMNVMRKAWIDEGKTRRREDKDDREDATMTRVEDRGAEAEKGSPQQGFEEDPASMFFGDENEPEQGQDEDRDAPDDDELDALLAEDTTFYSAVQHPADHERSRVDGGDGDELDALLEEHDKIPEPSTSRQPHDDHDSDQDALDALREHEE